MWAKFWLIPPIARLADGFMATQTPSQYGAVLPWQAWLDCWPRLQTIGASAQLPWVSSLALEAVGSQRSALACSTAGRETGLSIEVWREGDQGVCKAEVG